MNGYLLSASIIAFVVGLVHTVLGEVLIFRKLRQGRLIPTNGGSLLSESNVRILWASWHALTAFGWAIAFILFWLSKMTLSEAGGTYTVLEHTIAASMLVSAVLVLIGTKGKHPGWIGLSIVSVLVWMGTSV
ncbi:hypothetical protein EJP77_11305 [Paenibacillus zeisoli]|uniref:Uncharacterized protein n=1 Tax=Paenibacillus zeisoli TaxID=2496267 RepID=A0A433XCU2_9BACL|nr:hypothetical protein [Paenibacillus zeisoli]RUT31949.1 hypothetical protein EJP77_11305 [Paenibacillus zeisoli]